MLVLLEDLVSLKAFQFKKEQCSESYTFGLISMRFFPSLGWRNVPNVLVIVRHR